MIFTETITILRPARVRGDYGGYEESWDSPTEIAVDIPVSIQPVQATEDENHKAERTTDAYAGYTQPGVLLEELKHRDRIRVENWPGKPIYEVNGRPQHWRALLIHTEFNLEEINGTTR